MRARIEALRDAELEKALAEIARGGDPAQVMQRMGRTLVNEILHDPSIAMRQAAADGREDLLAFARALFAADNGDAGTRSPTAGSDPDRDA